MPTWKYEGKLITEISDMPEDTIGFIYKIRKKITGEFYIGRKSLYSHRTLPPLKGTKRKRKVVKESNWKKYQSSHSEVKKWDSDDIEKFITNRTKMIWVESPTNPLLKLVDFKKLCLSDKKILILGGKIVKNTTELTSTAQFLR